MIYDTRGGMAPRDPRRCGEESGEMGKRRAESDADDAAMPGCRAPIPSKCKQRFGAVSCKKRSIEMQLAVSGLR